MVKQCTNFDELMRTVQQRCQADMANKSSASSKVIQDALINAIHKNIRDNTTRWDKSESITSYEQIAFETFINGTTYGVRAYSKAKPRPSIFGQQLHKNSDTLFSEWINNGSWFDVFVWIKAGRPDDKENYYRDAKPFIEDARKNLKANKSKLVSELQKLF